MKIKKNDYRLLVLSFFFVFGIVFSGCDDFFHPVESTGTPTEYEFNYWLLSQTYLYENEVQNLPVEGENVQALYDALSDPYTRYVPPSQSSNVSTSLNTSLVEGDVGMEYLVIVTGEPDEHPILVSRVYPKSPAGRAKVPRYSRIIHANGIELKGPNAKAVYDSIVDYSAVVEITVYYDGDLKTYSLVKENIYAPTVFLDTIYGLTYVTITEFRLTTADEEYGTWGELKSYLDSTATESGVRILDLRNNPGGHVSQCTAMADLFIKEGTIATRRWFTLSADGERKAMSSAYTASPGDAGEKGKFIVLANGRSASCAEIFVAALKDNAKIPFAGEKTYGKGIGQSTWNTIDKGLAIITSQEFIPPSGQPYHHKGVIPDFPCEGSATRLCAAKAAEKFFGAKIVVDNSAASATTREYVHLQMKKIGGAIIPDSSSTIPFYNYRK